MMKMKICLVLDLISLLDISRSLEVLDQVPIWRSGASDPRFFFRSWKRYRWIVREISLSVFPKHLSLTSGLAFKNWRKFGVRPICRGDPWFSEKRRTIDAVEIRLQIRSKEISSLQRQTREMNSAEAMATEDGIVFPKFLEAVGARIRGAHGFEAGFAEENDPPMAVQKSEFFAPPPVREPFAA